MEHLRVTAPDISCEHCQSAIETAIGDLAGVETVSVDIPTKQVDVAYDPSVISPATIVRQLDEEGYPVAEQG
jgi:copper chaperone CopZ